MRLRRQERSRARKDGGPAPTAAPAPAGAKEGVGKYTLQYLEISPDYMDAMFEEYGVKAKDGVGSRKLTPEDMEDWYIELNEDGTGYLYWSDDNQGKIDGWELSGETLAFKAGVSDFDCTLKDGVMCVRIDDGYDMLFAAEGAKLPAVELITMEDFVDLLYRGDEEEAKPDGKEEEETKPAAEEAEEKKPAAQETGSGILGTYYLYAAIIDGYCVRMDDFPDAEDGTIAINGDGSFVISYPDTEDTVLSWAQEADEKFTLYDEEGSFCYDGLIEAEFDSDGVFYYYQAASAYVRIYALPGADVSGIETISIAEYNALAS